VTLFIPEIAHVILVLHAPKGSAKSTAQTLIKMLVDPSKPQLLTIHNDRQEFIQQLAHNYICYYDNVKQVPDWLSHEVCKAVTGVGQTKRKLFTDEEDIIFEYKRCLGFNGINVALTEPDALERSLMIDLEAIKEENRRLEAEVLAESYELRPRLLGYIFDILVKAMQIKPTIQLAKLPRMADFTVWGEAIARAMGYKDMEFLNAYKGNIGTQNVEAIENSMLGQAILKWFGNLTIDPKTRLWEGATAEVLEVLNRRAEEYKINVRSKEWPKSANSFTRRLKTIVPSLKEGFDMNIEIAKDSVGDITGRKGASIIRVWKVSSPPSPPPFEHKNRKDTLADNPGSEDNTLSESTPNTLARECSIGTCEDTSLTPKSEIRAQSEDIRPSEDSEAIFDTSILFRCYYCNVFITDSKQHYLNHGAIKHPHKPMFPTKAEIQKYGLQSQGRRWEC
jgi:hypothetical protein